MKIVREIEVKPIFLEFRIGTDYVYLHTLESHDGVGKNNNYEIPLDSEHQKLMDKFITWIEENLK